MQRIIIEHGFELRGRVAATVAATQPTFICSWLMQTSGDNYGASQGNFNSTNPVLVVPSPTQPNTRYIVDSLTLFNGSGANQTLILEKVKISDNNAVTFVRRVVNNNTTLNIEAM